MSVCSKKTALAIVVLMIMASACATAPPSNPENLCSIFEEKRGWHKAAVKAEKQWGTPIQIPMAIMYQESAFRARARPPRRYLLGFIPWRRPSSAYGYAQAIDGTWRQYLRATGESWRERSHFADANHFIQWYTNDAVRRNGIAATDAYRLYLNYHEGPGGYARKSYASKPWLLKAAERVQVRSNRYRAQYERCRESLKPGLWRRLWGW